MTNEGLPAIEESTEATPADAVAEVLELPASAVELDQSLIGAPQVVRDALDAFNSMLSAPRPRKPDWREIEPDFTAHRCGPDENGLDESPLAAGLQSYADAVAQVAVLIGITPEEASTLSPNEVAARLNDLYDLESAFDAITPDPVAAAVFGDMLFVTHGDKFGGDRDALLTMGLLRAHRLLANVVMVLGPMVNMLPPALRVDLTRYRQRQAVGYLTLVSRRWDEFQQFRRDTPLSELEDADNDPTEEPGEDSGEDLSDPLTNG
jgi:hypothetical protein